MTVGDPYTMCVRFSDETAMLTLLSGFASYQSYLSSVVCVCSWRSTNFLDLNVFKTKQLCIDILCNGTCRIGRIIQVSRCCVRYNIFHCKRNLSSDCTFFETLTQKLFLRLYRSIFQRLITCYSFCYYPALSVSNCTRLLKISHVSAKIIG